MCFLVLLSAIAFFAESKPGADTDHYAELERVFNERSLVQQQEHEAIMTRYTPLDQSTSTGYNEPGDEEMKENVKTPILQEPAQELTDTTRININTAKAEELQQLPGIGPAYSERIVEWRSENGKFTDVEQLLEIRGIGPARLEKIKALVEL